MTPASSSSPPPEADVQPAVPGLASAPRSRRRRRLAITFAALALGLAAPELCLRFLLFGDSPAARAWGQGWRDAGLYAVGTGDSVYWKLLYRFSEPEHRKPPNVYDPDLGWIKRSIDAETYAHEDQARLAGRRPVLLYGASFAACMAPAEDCFTALLERSELGRTHALINYGVGGYGLDQMLLLYRRTIPLFAGLDPIVVFAPVIESDLDRVLLDFRTWPKPRFRLAGDELRLEADLAPTSDEYLARHGMATTSFAWRYLVNGTDVLPQEWALELSGELELRRTQRRIVEGLIDRVRSEVESHGHACFFLLFRSHPALRPGAAPRWQEQHLVEMLACAGVPWVETGRYLRAAAERERVWPKAFYYSSGIQRGHLAARGNEIAFAALLDGLRGHFDESPP